MTSTASQIQASTLKAAREALARDHESGVEGLAVRVGVLEYHLGEMIALVDQLTQGSTR